MKWMREKGKGHAQVTWRQPSVTLVLLNPSGNLENWNWNWKIQLLQLQGLIVS